MIMVRRGKNFCQEKRDQYFTRIGMKEVVLETLLLFKCRTVEKEPFRREHEQEA